MVLDYLIYFFIFLLGVCIGSFLNCVIYRLEQKKSLSGRSFCPHCKHTLEWLDLLPIFSFIFLKGKCKYCHKKISWQYPLIEIMTGLVFLSVFMFQVPGFNLQRIINVFFLFYISGSLVIIFIYDFKHYLIPDKILFPAILIASAYRIIENYVAIPNYLLAVLAASGFFLVIFLISAGRWMGFGDVKLAILMGLLLGFPNVLTALFIAFFLGAIMGVIAMIFKKKTLKSEMPFGPFLIMGTFFALFWGQQLINWYFRLLF